jgi:hypothetical protein
MELASMLTGEPFTDQPRSVSPLIAEFLRTYNDGVDQAHRDDLYRFASEAVGTRDPATDRLRYEICRRWIHAHDREPRPVLLRCLPAALRTFGTRLGTPPIGAVAGNLAATLVHKHRPGAHEAALALVDDLIACRAQVSNQPEWDALPVSSRCRHAETGPR